MELSTPLEYYVIFELWKESDGTWATYWPLKFSDPEEASDYIERFLLPEYLCTVALVIEA